MGATVLPNAPPIDELIFGLYPYTWGAKLHSIFATSRPTVRERSCRSWISIWYMLGEEYVHHSNKRMVHPPAWYHTKQMIVRNKMGFYLCRRGYNGRNNIQYVSERIPNNALHHITPFPLHRSSKHRPCNEHIYQAYMDIPSRGWEERSWIVIGGPWCWTIALFFLLRKKWVEVEIKQRADSKRKMTWREKNTLISGYFVSIFFPIFRNMSAWADTEERTNHKAHKGVTQLNMRILHTFP